MEKNINSKYLDSLSESKKNKILNNIAKHYGISISDAESEVSDEDAEMLYEYIANDKVLQMEVYNDIEGKKYSKGGGGVGAEKEYKSIDIGGGNYVFTSGDKINPSNLVVGNIYEWTAGAERLFVEYVGREKDNADKKVGSSIGKQEGGNLYLFKFIGDSKPSYTGLSGMAIIRGNIVKQDNIYNEIEDSLNDEIKRIKKRITQAKREITTSKSESDKSNAKNRLAKTETYLAEQMKSNKELLDSLKDKKMKNGGGVKRTEVVLNEGNGKIINNLFNQWNNVKNQSDYDKWVKKVKETTFGTYGTISINEVLNKFEFDDSKINDVVKKDFKKEINNALNKMAQGGATKGFNYSIGGL